METLLFVHGNQSLAAVREHAKGGVRTVALDIQSARALGEAGITHATMSTYELPDSNVRAVDFLNAWSQKPLQNGKNIKQLLTYDGFSVWWCMEQWLFYSFLNRDPLNKIMLAIDAVMAVLRAEQPKHVLFFDDQTLYSRAIPVVAKAVGVPVQSIPAKKALREWFREMIRPWAIAQFLRVHIMARRAVWKVLHLLPRPQPQVSTGKRILAVCSYQWRTIEHPALKESVLGDPYLTPILEPLKGYAITHVDATQREYRGFGTLRAKVRSGKRHVLFEQYLARQRIASVRHGLRELRATARTLEMTAGFRESWLMDGIDLWQLVGPQFRCYFSHRLEGHLLDIACAKSLLEHEKPDLVIYPCEGGDLAYVFFKLCADAGIPSVGIQHGTISYSPLSVHLAQEMCQGKPECVPRPTKLLVYGAYYRDFLAQSGYPRNEITVVGNLRYDHFINAKKMSRDAMAKKYGLDPKKRIMLYATQVMPTPREGEEITRAVFQVAKELDLALVVKQHPGEPADTFYHALADEMGLRPLITKNASTLELLTASDFMIGSESTLNYEAMILDKPVIILNFGGGRKDWLPFVKEGAALGVYAPEGVASAVQKVLHNAKVKRELSAKMQKLVNAHCHRIDGKSAARAADVIKELVR
jgi:hypothetical protein